MLKAKKAISEESVHRIFKDNLKVKLYKKIVLSLIINAHRAERVHFSNWIHRSYHQEDTIRILSSDAKMFDIDDFYNAQNECGWDVNRTTANMKESKTEKCMFTKKVMVRHEVCSKGVALLVILDSESFDHDRYAQEVLPVARDYDNKILADN